MKFDREILIRTIVLPVLGYFAAKQGTEISPELAATSVALVAAIYDFVAFFFKKRNARNQ